MLKKALYSAVFILFGAVTTTHAVADCGGHSGIKASDLKMVEIKPDNTPIIDDGALFQNSIMGNKKALDALRRCAQTDPEAMSFMSMYYAGKDDVQSLNWLLKADAAGGDVGCNLGKIYDLGQGVPPNPDKAAKWYLKSAENGDDSCQFNLGLIYLKGEGVPKSMTEAAKWWGKAAEKGNVTAQINLGVMYEKGDGVSEDKAQAVHYYNLACKGGNADGCFNAGVLTYNGDGIARNKDVGVALIRQALKIDPNHERAKAVIKKLGE